MVGLKPYRKNGLKNFSKQSVMIFKNDIRCTILYTIFIRTRARKHKTNCRRYRIRRFYKKRIRILRKKRYSFIRIRPSFIQQQLTAILLQMNLLIFDTSSKDWISFRDTFILFRILSLLDLQRLSFASIIKESRCSHNPILRLIRSKWKSDLQEFTNVIWENRESFFLLASRLETNLP